MILSFIDHQGIESRFKLVIACDLAHQSRNDFAEITFTLDRGNRFIPSYAGSVQQFMSQTLPAANDYFSLLALSLCN